ncbi:PHP domain-containing protein [Candidatus Clostridium radicumherbarum]|uniref:PHP domain-containing protein n=1 Tax=Candidatus Clostridium radicumherbarum TaxID=3381662 RepID=A0ABW8TUN3_9CLOT
MNGIDLHVHTYNSDGTNSPKEIINIAKKTGLSAISITDHDSIEGNEEAREEAEKCSIDYLSGVELSVSYGEGRLLHILGLGIDIYNEEFLKVYKGIRTAREKSVGEILEILKGKGIAISIEVLIKRSLKKNLDRYDIHRYFMEEKLCSSAQEVWDKYLDPIPYKKEEILSAEEAIYIIKKAGGRSFLAHYNKNIGLGGLRKSDMEKEIKNLKDLGLHGIEKYYPSFTLEDEQFADYLLEKYKLLASGGTDFHGGNRADIRLGIGNGEFNVPYAVYKSIINSIRNG